MSDPNAEDTRTPGMIKYENGKPVIPENPTTEQANAIHDELQKPPEPGKPTDAFKGLADEEKLRKQTEFVSMIVQQQIQPIKIEQEQQGQILQQIKSLLEKIPADIISQPQPGQTPPLPEPGQPQSPDQMINTINNLGPQEKALALSGMMDGISKLIMAWKSGGQQNQQPNEFQKMSQEITTTLLQAGVDGIMRNVYDHYNPIPRKPYWQQPPGQQPQPQESHKLA